MNEKPLRFLRYFIFSRYDVDLLREDQIYSWLVKNESLCGYATAPLRFAEELATAALAYRYFLRGRDHTGHENPVVQNIQLLGGSAARQHLILLLAGRHLSADLFARLCMEVEALFFVYVITREPTRDFERNFARWAMDIRKVKSAAELSEVIAKRFTPAKGDLAARFDDALRRLAADDVQKYRLRYILAKLTQRVDLDGFGEHQGTKWLSRYAGGDFEIEHVFPQNPSLEASDEFGDGADSTIAARLGNLVLIEKSINGALGNKPFSQKRAVYMQSQALLSRSIAQRPEVGQNTKIDGAVAPFTPFQTWNAATIAMRQDQLVALAKRVWNMPNMTQP